MSIEVRWDNDEKTIIYYTFHQGWTFKEFHEVYAEVYEMLDTVNHTVHAIVDLGNTRIFPTDTLREMRNLTFEQHENGGITVIITHSRMAHSLYSVLKSIITQFAQVFHLVHTLDEAYDCIAEHDQRILANS